MKSRGVPGLNDVPQGSKLGIGYGVGRPGGRPGVPPGTPPKTAAQKPWIPAGVTWGFSEGPRGSLRVLGGGLPDWGLLISSIS